MNIEKEIFTLIESKCANRNECLIDLNDLPLPKWDNAYIFSNVSKSYIQEKIKVPYTLYKDIGVKIIFTFNGEITSYAELFPVLDDGMTKSKIIFSFDGSKWGRKQMVNYYRLGKSDTKMKVVKQEYSNDGYSYITTYIVHPENAGQVGD
ncbi:hypothetical protein H8I69_03880 [Serratia fonticola]|uniref:hypothetical protein n=1 Tax=Serratia fonticola TaxID=47917 RepID=UPI0015C677D0|nr:hypothetical protein [Serratia fonticola]MBC3378259.1 hypothetical protein [Serratia fonticola]NYA37459.1 hypothetical protein [Serratia fonticola]